MRDPGPSTRRVQVNVLMMAPCVRGVQCFGALALHGAAIYICCGGDVIVAFHQEIHSDDGSEDIGCREGHPHGLPEDAGGGVCWLSFGGTRLQRWTEDAAQ
ncbi:hypothetical protein PLESTM_000964800 [Pleodorina starrii]|nr:hypothetical protein PLESTM_000964800 [Pleodorina starrii]